MSRDTSGAHGNELFVRWLGDLRATDVEQVGGKNASLGEMISHLDEVGIRVPGGFATTAAAYRTFIQTNDLEPRIARHLDAWEKGVASLSTCGQAIRTLVLEAPLPPRLEARVREAYLELGRQSQSADPEVAVRSSATAEDLPEASFAGQHDSYLGVHGTEALLETCRHCYASLFTDRAISYRHTHGFDHLKIALSVGVQTMVRADRGAAGVMFTLDTETGFPDVVQISAAWGFGESVVQGTVDPDHYVVHKPLLRVDGRTPIIDRRIGAKATKTIYVSGANGSVTSTHEDSRQTTTSVPTSERERVSAVLSDDEVLQLARWAVDIETHYERPMDIEWARDGDTGELFILQARPETVQARGTASTIRHFRLTQRGEPVVSGQAIGSAIAAGEVCLLAGADQIEQFRPGSILVTSTTDPDWVPIMRQAAGVVTDHGGRTSHAAIVSRELGLPAIVGTGNATRVLEDGRAVTVSCAEADQGMVYDGLLTYEEESLDLEGLPTPRTRIMMNVASPAAAFRWWRLPCRGVGLARMEYIIEHEIRVHPLALTRFHLVDDPDARATIESFTSEYSDRTEFFVERLSFGIGKIAAAYWPDPVIVRTSDFKTNEYANLIGGAAFEPEEANPMLGWRGASRYYSNDYRDGFALECRAIKRVRDVMGLTNVVVMIPFCRTVGEADLVLQELANNELVRGENGLEVYVMAELPSNIMHAKELAERFDGFSIGSNDLTQLMLGIDRDAERLAYLFDERDDAVKEVIRELVARAHAAGRPVGICGQAPSDYPEFAEFLVEIGIDSISLNPDSVLDVIPRVAAAEARQKNPGALLEV